MPSALASEPRPETTKNASGNANTNRQVRQGACEHPSAEVGDFGPTERSKARVEHRRASARPLDRRSQRVEVLDP